jgi:hypothetical protein
MPNQRRFPTKDADFNVAASIIITYLNANKARLVLTPAAIAALASVNIYYSTSPTSWLIVYPLSQNVSAGTSSYVSEKDTDRQQIETGLTTIYGDIPQSTLTQVDRDTLNLPIPSGTRTPAPVPTGEPIPSVESHGTLLINIFFTDKDTKVSKSKPTDVDAVEVEGAFLANGVTAPTGFPQDADYRHLGTVGTMKYERIYTKDQIKGSEFIRARYLNTRKESGNWGSSLEVVVS